MSDAKTERPEMLPDLRDRAKEIGSHTIVGKAERPMLWTIFLILLILWLLGVVSAYTLGGFIHILLLVALAVLLINIIEGRRPAL